MKQALFVAVLLIFSQQAESGYTPSFRPSFTYRAPTPSYRPSAPAYKPSQSYRSYPSPSIRPVTKPVTPSYRPTPSYTPKYLSPRQYHYTQSPNFNFSTFLIWYVVFSSMNHPYPQPEAQVTYVEKDPTNCDNYVVLNPCLF